MTHFAGANSKTLMNFSKMGGIQGKGIHTDLPKISESFSNGLLQVMFHPNYEPSTSPNQLPHGVTLMLDPKAVFTALMLSDQLGTVRVVSQIVDMDYTDDYFRSNSLNLKEIPLSAGESGPALDVIGATRDTRPWTASLGETGEVSVMKEEGDLGKDTYYLVVKSSVDSLAKSLRTELMARSASQKTPMTVGEFINSPEYRGLMDITLRNAKRILHDASVLLKVNLVGGSSDDMYVILEDTRMLPPQLANPALINYSDVFVDHSCSGGSCNYYSKTTPISLSVGAILVGSSPISPSVLFFHPKQESSLKQWAKEHHSIDFSTPPSTLDQPSLPKFVPIQNSNISTRTLQLVKNTTVSDTPTGHIPSFALGTRAPPSLRDIERFRVNNGAQFGHTILKPVISRF